MSLETQSSNGQETEDPLHQTSIRKIGAVGLNGAGRMNIDIDQEREDFLEHAESGIKNGHSKPDRSTLPSYEGHSGIDEEHPHIIPGQE